MNILTEALREPVLAAQLQEIVQLRRGLLQRTIESQPHDAKLSVQPSTQLISEMLAGAIWYRLIFQFGPVDDDYIKYLVGVANKLH